MTDLTGGDRDSATAMRPDINASKQKLDPDTAALLQLFLDQSCPIRSIVAVGNCQMQWKTGKDASSLPSIRVRDEAALLRFVTDKDSGPSITPPMPLQPPERSPGGMNAYALDSLARQARELARAAPGIDLLLSRADTLNEMMTPLTDDFGFRAVAVLSSQPSAQPGNEDSWQLRRRLFDRGLICIGGVRLAGENAFCFLASDDIRSLRRRDVGSRGHVSMSTLGSQGRFGNQLFQYAYVKLYALRHGLTPAFPPWEGSRLFGLDDEPCAGLAFRRLAFEAFSDEDRLLWDSDEPPIDVDFSGYFQEIPECWRRHRPLIRRLFQPPREIQSPVDAWHQEVTRGGKRTLVAIHVRRGDYRLHQHRNAPWFRLVPEDWYLDWLRTIWPTLCDPLLFVATDEPAAVLPVFQEFDSISAKLSFGARALPDHVRDFEILRRADYLAIGNSSFSRMAAILAPSTQKCFLPSFQMQKFLPYEPWIDPAFWARFADSAPHAPAQRTP